jgi:hypothetical protein
MTIRPFYFHACKQTYAGALRADSTNFAIPDSELNHLNHQPTNPMNIKLPLPKWLARRFARPRPGRPASAKLKQRQLLPTLPKRKRRFIRFQDGDRPPGYRIQWRQ